MKFQSLLDEFVRDARQCFGEALTGVYLHGSLALNGFNPEKSDIDLILITETAPSDAQKRAFMDRAVLLNERARPPRDWSSASSSAGTRTRSPTLRPSSCTSRRCTCAATARIPTAISAA